MCMYKGYRPTYNNVVLCMYKIQAIDWAVYMPTCTTVLCVGYTIYL